ncbi:MAG: DNA-binding response regulator [Betaproteobacteria bacterium]|nr:MAG: DNA-binding response regulator [Betaproteobacteria bacterium]
MAATGIAVALVEDDDKFRLALCNVVSAAEGLRLLGAAATLVEGRALLARESPDVLLVDLELPDGSGLALIEEARRQHPECDAMVVTVFGDERNVFRALEAGATGYLLKDMAGPELADHIRRLHAGGSPISPVIARQLLQRFQPIAPVPASGVPALSAREQAVLELISKGFTFDEIARLQEVSSHTVSTYVKRIYAKLQVRSKTEAVYEATKLGLLRT